MSSSINTNRIWQAGLLAVILSVISNLIIRATAQILFDIPAEFVPLSQPVTTIVFTILGVAGGVIVFYVLARRSARPVSSFRLIVIVVLIISWVPDVLLLLSAQPGATVAGVATLMLMHAVAAFICYSTLTGMTARR